jgi:photosystem II stability/assembly factor-like uncharacterized protein
MTGARVKLALLTAALALTVALPASRAAVGTGHSGWRWANPVPQGQTLWAADLEGDVGYAAGNFGTLLRTTDGGVTWSGLETGLTANLRHVSVIDADSVVVAGDCAVRRSDDSGLSFKRLPWRGSDERCASPIVAVAFPADPVGYLVTADGAVLRTADAGLTWSRQSDVPGGSATDAAFTSAGSGVVTTSTGAIYRTSDGGTAWTLAHQDDHALNSVDFPSATVGYAVGDPGTLLRSVDGGRTWTSRTAPTISKLASIRCTGLLTCLIAGTTQDNLIRTDDGGLTFDVVPSTAGGLAVAFGTGRHALAVGALGKTLLSEDDGATWSQVGGRLAGNFTRLRAPSPRQVFAVGREGDIARSLDGGATWQTIHVPSTQDITDVSFAGRDVGYALDLVGRVFRTNDAGVTWRRVKTGFSAKPQAVLASSASSVLLIGPHGILRSTHGGSRFARIRSEAAQRAKIFEVDRAGRALVAFGSRRIALSRNGGRTWKSVKRPPRALIAAVDFVSARVGFMLEQNGRLWRTDNRGRTWDDLAAVGTDEAIGLAFSSARRGYLVLPRFGDDAGGYVLRTSDGGHSWRPQLLGSAPLAAAGVVAKGSADFALATDDSLFFTTSGGDTGFPSKVRLTTPRRRLAGGRRIQVSGSITGAAPGSKVLVARRLRGESGWDRRFVEIGAGGSFTSTWTVTRTTTFVAQWIGDDDQAGDGSLPLTVRVR